MPAYYLEALTITLGLVLLVAEAFVTRSGKAWVGMAAALGLAGILALAGMAVGPEAAQGSSWGQWPLWRFYQWDPLARFYKVFALVCTLLVVLMSVDYRKILMRYTDHPGTEAGTGEYYALPVFACGGMMFLASAKDLAGAFVALELVTVTFYILVAYMRRNVGSLEAGVKYLIIGALSTGFLVYGIAWVYGATGTMNLAGMPAALARITEPEPMLFGVALVMVGLGFKIGVVPMQVWIPDVYQGAPTPTTAFLSVGSKAAGFILLMRFLEPLLGSDVTRGPVLGLMLILSVATLLFGNLAALPQSNFKRLLGYSSIAHAGFLLLALAAGTSETSHNIGSFQVVSFYLATYLIMTLGIFFVLGQVRIQRDGEEIADFNGLGKTNPTLATAITILLAALAGVPLTAGFIGKFFVFAAAVDAQLWPGVIAAAIGAAAGFYYYFGVVRAMWWSGPGEQAGVTLPVISKVCLAVLTIATVLLGLWPDPILMLMQNPPAMETSLRIGVIGLGNMGRVYARNLLEGGVPRARLAAVCNRHREPMRQFDDIPGFSDAGAMMTSGDVDAVVIATPHFAHVPLGVEALERGLHVLIDKPVGVHKNECLRLIEAQRRHPECVCAAMFNQRTDPFYQEIRKLVQGGTLGEVRRIHWIITNWFRTDAYYQSQSWRATWRGEGGGVLLNQCPHNLDLWQWIFGLPSAVRAFCRFGRYHAIEVEDDVTAYLEYGAGASGVFITTTGEAPGTNRLEVTMDGGKLVYENDRLVLTRNTVSTSEFCRTSPDGFAAPATETIEYPIFGHGPQHAGVLTNFVDAILDGVPLIAPAAEGLLSVELANAMLQSTWTGQTVPLPMDGNAYEAQLQARIDLSPASINPKRHV